MNFKILCWLFELEHPNESQNFKDHSTCCSPNVITKLTELNFVNLTVLQYKQIHVRYAKKVQHVEQYSLEAWTSRR